MVVASLHMSPPYFFFGNNRSNRTTDVVENVPQSWFSGFHSSGTGVFEEKISKPYSVPYFPKKRLYSFLSSIPHSLKKWSYFQKLFFTVILENIVFFFKLLYEKYLKSHFLQKKFILIFVTKNGHVPPQMVFSNFFNINREHLQGFLARNSCERKFFEE